MELRTSYKRAVLSEIAEQSANADDLLTSLKALRSARFSDFKSGKSIVSVSANGHSYTFAEPATGQMQPADLMEFAQEMIELYAAVKTEAITQTKDILTAMLACDALNSFPCTQKDHRFTGVSYA